MSRRRAASRKEDWLAHMRRALGSSRYDALLLDLFDRSVRQAYAATGEEDPAEDIASLALGRLELDFVSDPDLVADPKRLENRRYQLTRQRIYRWFRKRDAEQAGIQR